MIPFIDLKSQYRVIEKEIQRNIEQVLNHGQFILGPEVNSLEKQLAEFVGVNHCVAVSSGTDALLVALMALGIGHGDEVITTPFSFIATAEVILLVGAIPVFVDINPKTYTIEPKLIDAAITPQTKAIIPVSLYGQCADIDAINAIAAKHSIPVIEDAAQSFGATYKGRQSCSLSTIACTSFFPAKPLGAYGDAGACFTNDAQLSRIMREISVHGQDKRYHHCRVGINGRLDTFQAAILLAKLTIFKQEVMDRIRIANRYTEKLSANRIHTPYIEPFNTSVYAQYTIEVDDRERIINQLNEAKIPTAIHYPIPLHQQPAVHMEHLQLPQSENAAKKVLSLPMHPYLSESDQDYIIQHISKSVISK
ncbi:MAG: DegT/DnrJ/EryC1/StrS family aminotransferase [Desulfobacterales bacterium]|nr:DegT/DnrJ/EryC1/StrS family aminotransferase [Desulfobacterales bacterium]